MRTGLRIAANKHIPTLIQEQNSYPALPIKCWQRNQVSFVTAYEFWKNIFPLKNRKNRESGS